MTDNDAQPAELVRCWFCNSDTPKGRCAHCGVLWPEVPPRPDPEHSDGGVSGS